MAETNTRRAAKGAGDEAVDHGDVLFCPRCGSERLHRSHRANAFERIVLRALWIRPYRCESCNARFHSWRRKLAR